MPFWSIDCTAPCVMRSISVENFWPCAPKVLRNTPVFSSSTRLQIVAALVDVGGQFLRLGGEAARDLGADAEQRALHFAGILLQRGGDAGRDGA